MDWNSYLMQKTYQNLSFSATSGTAKGQGEKLHPLRYIKNHCFQLERRIGNSTGSKKKESIFEFFIVSWEIFQFCLLFWHSGYASHCLLVLSIEEDYKSTFVVEVVSEKHHLFCSELLQLCALYKVDAIKIYSFAPISSHFLFFWSFFVSFALFFFLEKITHAITLSSAICINFVYFLGNFLIFIFIISLKKILIPLLLLILALLREIHSQNLLRRS